MLEKLKEKLEVINRVKYDVTMLIILLGIASIFLPSITGLFTILISKMVFIYAGVIMAHITRSFLFPYIDFATEKEWSNNVMIIAIYIIIIYCMANGG